MEIDIKIQREERERERLKYENYTKERINQLQDFLTTLESNENMNYMNEGKEELAEK